MAGTDLHTEAARLLLGVSQGLAHQVRRPLDPLLRHHGLTSTLQVALLGCLAHGPERRAADLAEELRCPFSTLSGSLDHLVGAGLVVRRPNPTDRRSHVLEVTAAGRGLLAEFREEATRHLAEMLAELDDQAATDVLAALERLAELMRRRGAVNGWLAVGEHAEV